MRGALCCFPPVASLTRIIPADAGSTRPSSAASHIRRDHPRGCGEHPIHAMTGTAMLGSSPRMRGAQDHRVRALDDGGIIPADAGSTYGLYTTYRVCRDHPRGCGEHAIVNARMSQSGGSSPRMRGAPWQELDDVIALRIIPADAGSTMYAPSMSRSRTDHPRGCGEHQTPVP